MDDNRSPYEQAYDALHILLSGKGGPSAGDAALDDIFELLGDQQAREFLNAHGVMQAPPPGPPDRNSSRTGIAWNE